MALFAPLHAQAHAQLPELPAIAVRVAAIGNDAGQLADNTVTIAPDACGYSPVELQYVIAHELGHAMARQRGYQPNDELTADLYASRLLRANHVDDTALMAIWQERCPTYPYSCHRLARWQSIRRN